MGKNKKKRNKAYTGPGAAITKPVITKVAAVDRSKLSQWIFEHKSILKTVITVVLIAGAVTFIVLEIIRALNS
jgi:hypothetical protein